MFYSIGLGLLGGLGLFLYGMKMMSSGVQKAAGDNLRRILEVLTSNPYIATFTGIVVTILVQSSSTTTVMVVGFVNSGLMNLAQGLGVMLGGNIGTTITAQMVSFDIYFLLYPVIAIGAAMNLFCKKRIYRTIGQSILGFGILFLGLKTMSESMRPLRDYEPFLNLLSSFGNNPILGVIVGALFTALIQSSSATTGVVIALTIQGIIDTPSAISVMLGANIGTSITAVIACIGTSLTAKRAVLALVMVKVSGVIVALLLFMPFNRLILLTGDSVTRQVANAHTIFNVINVIMVLPFIKAIANLVTKLMPGEEVVVESGTKYINDQVLRTPALAIKAAKEEVIRMAKIAMSMVSESVDVVANNSSSSIDSIIQKESLVDSLEKEITTFIAQISQSSLNQDQSRRINSLLHACSDIERIGDHAENIVNLGEAKIEEGIVFSDIALKEISVYSKIVLDMIDGSIKALANDDINLARQIIKMDDDVDYMERRFRKNHINRLNDKLCVPHSGVIFLDLISNLERVADHATNLAEVVTGDFFKDARAN